MLNVISILIGIVAGLVMVVGLVPFLGLVNWLMLPIAGLGLLFGLVSRGKAGRNLNLIVLLVGIVRLWLGGGIL